MIRRVTVLSLGLALAATAPALAQNFPRRTASVASAARPLWTNCATAS